MKKNTVFWYISIILFLSAAGYAADISLFIGEITLIRKGKNIPVTAGKILEPGDLLKTGTGSFIEIRYRDGSTIRINERSSATIGSRNIPGSENLSLVSGNMTANIKKIMKGTAKSYSPTNVCAVRGTEYTMTVDSGGDTRVDVSEGAVEITSPGGTAAAKPKATVETRMGEKPSPGAGTREEWTKARENDFEKDPAAQAGGYDRQLDALEKQTLDAGKNLTIVRSAVTGADTRESLEKAESLLTGAEDKTTDGLYMNEALNLSAGELAAASRQRDQNRPDRFNAIRKKSDSITGMQLRNREALNRIREEYLKARDRIMGTYRDKMDEIKSRFNKKKSDI